MVCWHLIAMLLCDFVWSCNLHQSVLYPTPLSVIVLKKQVTFSLPSRELTYPTNIPHSQDIFESMIFFPFSGVYYRFLKGASGTKLVLLPFRCPWEWARKFKVTWLIVGLMAQHLQRSRKPLNRFLAAFLPKGRDMIIWNIESVYYQGKFSWETSDLRTRSQSKVIAESSNRRVK